MRSILALCVIFGVHVAASDDQGQHSVAIVGAGVSGLYLALRLYDEYGVSNIDIYEQEQNAGSTITSIDTKSEFGALDIATVTIPIKYNDDKINYGISPQYYSLLTRYDSISREQAFVRGMDHISQQLIPSLSFILNGVVTNITKLIDESIDLLLLFEEIRQKNMTKITQFYEYGYTQKGESIQEWGIRKGLSNAVYFCSAVCQIFLFQHDWPKLSASYHLHYYLKWRVPNIIEALRFVGYNSEYFQDLGEEYEFMYNLAKYHESHELEAATIIKPSFQALFDNVVEELQHHGNKISFNHKVVDINTELIENKTKLNVKYKEPNNAHTSTKQYDFVFVTAKSRNLFQFLDANDFKIRYEMFWKYTSMRTLHAIYVQNTEHLSVPSFWKDGGFAMYPLMNVAGLIDNNVSDCRPNFIYVIDDQNQFVSYGMGPTVYPGDKFDIEEFRNKCINKFISYYNEFYSLNVAKDDIQQIYSWYHYSEISNKGEKNNFYETIEELQGENGLFIIGETVSGITIANVVQYIENNIQRFYSIINTC